MSKTAEQQIHPTWKILIKHLEGLEEGKYPVFSCRKRIVEAMEEYAQHRVEEATRWIPVSERLPEINCYVAVRTKNKETAIMSFHAHPEEVREFHRWMFGKWQKQTSIVTHWTTIPPLPKAPTV